VRAVRLLVAVLRLPPGVRSFWLKATLVALRRRDRWSLVSSARPSDLGRLLELARGRQAVFELGTGSGWTAISLALADSSRRVVSYDPHDLGRPDRYLGLVGETVRDRIELRPLPGESGPASGERVDLLFLDSSHQREETLSSFQAWRDAVVPGGIVAFHDCDHPAYPGVREAIEQLDLDGELHDGLFVWRNG
jgi:predicted O-methyltransferase YrrM